MLKQLVIGVLLLVLLSSCGAPTPVNEVAVTMGDFYYDPATLTILVGQTISITLVNTGALEHDFVVEKIDVSSVSSSGDVGGHHMGGSHSDYDLHVSVEAGGTSVLKFTANQPGTYKIFCSVEGHEEAGMVAELIVVSE
jgi:uncharacterized cupredoxin-like copper-binding protein